MDHQPPSDGQIGISDCEEGLQPKHQPGAQINTTFECRLKQRAREDMGKDFLNTVILISQELCHIILGSQKNKLIH